MTIDKPIILHNVDERSVEVFSNNLILHQIAKECDVEDLKSFRLVCTACYDASLPIWRKRAAICLGPFQGWGRISVQEFMGRFETSEEGPFSIRQFQNFKLEFGSIPPVHLTKEELECSAEFRFWRKFGSAMKHLHLNHCKFDQSKLVNVVCNLAPNLESLVIVGVRKASGVGVQFESDQLKIQANLKVLHVLGQLPFPNWRFLKYFPNLKEIKLRKYSNENLIPDLCTIRRDDLGQSLNLRTLDLIATQQSLHGLVEAHSHLEYLSLRLERDIQEENLRDILHSQCSTLQTLKLFRFPLPFWSPLSSSPLHVNFSSLKELQLWGKVVSSFDFLKWMPSLKKLVVDLLCHDKSFDIYDDFTSERSPLIQPYYGNMVNASKVLMGTEGFEHPNLEDFQIDYEFNLESLKTLKKWIPNLKRFKCILNNTTLRLVCGQWEKLEELKLLFGSDVCDEGITGVTLASAVGKEERQPNLTDLSQLRSFEYECYCNASPISDVSAHLAFLKMPQLERLKVCVSEQLTLPTEILLKESSISDVQILRNYGEDDHSDLPINCCQRTAFFFSNFSFER